MNEDKPIDSINDIRDEAITEYAEKKKAAKAPHHFPWGIIAISLAVAIIIFFTPKLIYLFSDHNDDCEDPKAGADFYFDSYAQLRLILPEGNILTNIPNGKNAKIEAHGICPKGTTDFADYNNYSYLDVHISYGDGTGFSIFCINKSEKSTQEYVEYWPMFYPSDKISVETVKNCQVYSNEYENYSFDPKDSGTVLTAVFSIDGNLYEITTATFNHEELIQLIEKLICPE